MILDELLLTLATSSKLGCARPSSKRSPGRPPMQMISVKEAAAKLAASDRQVRRFIARKVDRLPSYKIGNQVRISVEELEDWLAKKRQ